MPDTRSHPGRHGTATAHVGSGLWRRAGFTLVELLFTVAIVAVLVSMLLPAVGRALGAARAFKCQMTLRSVAFDFHVYADRHLHGDRGDDRDLEARGLFRLENFQDSQYGLHEFWPYGGLTQVSLPDSGGRDPMRCPEVKGEVRLRRDTPCSMPGAITPQDRISYGFNLRLHRLPAGPVLLSSDVVEKANVPLLWDVDAPEAVRRGVLPVFSAPALGSTWSLLAGDRLWFPARRHLGASNVAFVDGHVAPSANPLGEPGWNWDFEPR